MEEGIGREEEGWKVGLGGGPPAVQPESPKGPKEKLSSNYSIIKLNYS